MREKTIAVSTEEQTLLDNAAEEMTGTTDLPYGATITMLVREATNVDIGGN